MSKLLVVKYTVSVLAGGVAFPFWSVSVLTAKQAENPPNSGLRLVKTSFPFF